MISIEHTEYAFGTFNASAVQVYNLDVHGIFDDENVTDEQWAEWKKEANK